MIYHKSIESQKGEGIDKIQFIRLFDACAHTNAIEQLRVQTFILEFSLCILCSIMSGRPSLRENIYLIGDIETQIYGNKLPSKEQALKALFYNLKIVKLNRRESARMVVREIQIYWDKA